jgi:hypothetical protein
VDPPAYPALRRPALKLRPGERSWRSLDPATAAVVLAVAGGIAVRLALWWQDRAFWRDELGLVQSLDVYPVSALLGRLSDT